MKQHDKHWPYLSCRETLTYAAELYEVAEKGEISDIVEEMIRKMGLNVCADTRCARLSGGQRRRLSIAIALLKQVSLTYCILLFSVAVLGKANNATVNLTFGFPS